MRPWFSSLYGTTHLDDPTPPRIRSAITAGSFWFDTERPKARKLEPNQNRALATVRRKASQPSFFWPTDAFTTALQSACSCSRWLRRTSLLGFFGGWGFAEKSPHSLRVALSVGRLHRKHSCDCIFAGLENLCQTTSSGFCSSRAHFQDRKPFSNVCTTRSLSYWRYAW